MIINEIYSLNQGYECLSACLGNYIKYKYQDISNGEIIIAGNGLEVTYNTNDKILSTSMYKANFEFLKRYNILYEYGNLHNEQQAYELIQKCVSNGRALIVKVCAEYLDYSRVFKQSDNSSHCVNIVGFDGNRLYICDGYVPTRSPTVYEGWIDSDTLIKGWSRKEYEYLILDDNYSLIEQNVLTDAKNSLLIGIESYLNGKSDGAVYNGENAIRKLLCDVEDIMKQPERRNFIIDINYQIKIYGFLSLKMIVCNWLKKYSLLNTYAREYEEIIQAWNNCCSALMKTGISGRLDYFISTKEKILLTCNRESLLLNKLKEELNADGFHT